MLFLLLLLPLLTCAQIAELASLVSGVVAPQAAGGAAGALGSIGTLYQLAQNALQLTGMGVGILNQASEGKWFSSAAENAVNNNHALQDRLLAGGARPQQLSLLGSQSIGQGGGGGVLGFPSSLGGGAIGFPSIGTDPEISQLGKQFTAPEPEDYEAGEEKGTTKTASLFAVENTDPPEVSKSSKVATTTESMVTLFPDESEETESNKSDEVDASVKKSGKKVPSGSLRRGIDMEYYDSVNGEPSVDDIYQEMTDEYQTTDGSGKEGKLEKLAPTLSKLISLLRRSDVNEKDLEEVVLNLKDNRQIPKSAESTAPNRQALRTVTPKPHSDGKGPSESTDDSDLLKFGSTAQASRVTIGSNNMNGMMPTVAPTRIPPPESFKKPDQLRVRNSWESRSLLPMGRAFAVPSQTRGESPVALPGRLYPRRFIRPSPSTPEPVVWNSAAVGNSAITHPSLFSAPSPQRSQFSGSGNPGRDGSARFTLANGNFGNEAWTPGRIHLQSQPLQLSHNSLFFNPQPFRPFPFTPQLPFHTVSRPFLLHPSLPLFQPLRPLQDPFNLFSTQNHQTQHSSFNNQFRG